MLSRVIAKNVGGVFLRHSVVISEFTKFRYLDAYANTGDSHLSDVENDTKFRTFRPL